MKTKNLILNRALGGTAFAGAVLLLASSAPAQNLFVANASTDTIDEFTPGGTQSTFAADSGLLEELAFQPVPEPSVYALLGLGAAGLFTLCYRMRNKTISI